MTVFLMTISYIVIGINIFYWAIILFAVWKGIRALQQGRVLASIVWTLLAATPFAYFQHQYSEADNVEEKRAQLVANFAREPMPNSYPRVLEIYGYMTAREIILYLDTLDIDSVLMFQSKAQNGELRAEKFELVSDCRGTGVEYLKSIKRGKSIKSTRDEERYCLSAEKLKVSADRTSIPAIVFLQDHNTTLRMEGNTVWMGGNLEARVRTQNTDTLLDYWEIPYLRKPSRPDPVGHIFQENTNWKNYYRPGRIKFFAGAVGLMPRWQVAKAEKKAF